MIERPKFLRNILFFDGATCAAMGAALMAGARPLTGLIGLPASLLLSAGAILIAFAALLLWAGRQHPVPVFAATAIVLGNVAWGVASLLLVTEGPFALTAIGAAIVIAQALAVILLAAVEFLGFRRMAAPAR